MKRGRSDYLGCNQCDEFYDRLEEYVLGFKKTNTGRLWKFGFCMEDGPNSTTEKMAPNVGDILLNTSTVL